MGVEIEGVFYTSEGPQIWYTDGDKLVRLDNNNSCLEDSTDAEI